MRTVNYWLDLYARQRDCEKVLAQIRISKGNYNYFRRVHILIPIIEPTVYISVSHFYSVWNESTLEQGYELGLMKLA